MHGAKGYEVEIENAERKASKLTLKSTRTELRVPGLAEGSYVFLVRRGG